MKKCLSIVVLLLAVGAIAPSVASGPQPHQRNRNPVRQSNRDMRQAMRLAHQAHEILRSALPVYDGRRVDAMEAIRSANTELSDALKGIPFDDKPPLDKDGKPIKRKRIFDNDPRSKYPGDQIAISDQKLRQADGRIGDAIGMLDNADPMYHGEREDAIKRLRNAQGLIAAALAIR